ncbi:hypothetical protein [Salinarimonas chemoclinalis]|uniref:hypothetical protein n=1 Tax=Salinarimonas chemoclinalis TaxID=3241599 RepID=UPI0035571E90
MRPAVGAILLVGGVVLIAQSIEMRLPQGIEPMSVTEAWMPWATGVAGIILLFLSLNTILERVAGSSQMRGFWDFVYRTAGLGAFVAVIGATNDGLLESWTSWSSRSEPTVVVGVPGPDRSDTPALPRPPGPGGLDHDRRATPPPPPPQQPWSPVVGDDITEATRRIAANPDNASAYEQRAALRQRSNRDLRGAFEDYVIAGEVHLSHDDWPSARDAFGHALGLAATADRRRMADALLGRAFALMEMSEFEGARRDIDRAEGLVRDDGRIGAYRRVMSARGQLRRS